MDISCRRYYVVRRIAWVRLRQTRKPTKQSKRLWLHDWLHEQRSPSSDRRASALECAIGGGATGTRTPDPLLANLMFSQQSGTRRNQMTRSNTESPSSLPVRFRQNTHTLHTRLHTTLPMVLDTTSTPRSARTQDLCARMCRCVRCTQALRLPSRAVINDNDVSELTRGCCAGV
jgi:hypothetical protein